MSASHMLGIVGDSVCAEDGRGVGRWGEGAGDGEGQRVGGGEESGDDVGESSAGLEGSSASAAMASHTRL